MSEDHGLSERLMDGAGRAHETDDDSEYMDSLGKDTTPGMYDDGDSGNTRDATGSIQSWSGNGVRDSRELRASEWTVASEVQPKVTKPSRFANMVLDEYGATTGASELEEEAQSDEEGVNQTKMIRRGIKHLTHADRFLLRMKHRERRRKHEQGTVFSYSVSASFLVRPMLRLLRQEGLKPRQYSDVAHVELKGAGDVFIFFYGCVVFWGVQENLGREFLDSLKPFQVGLYSQMEEDDFDYVIGDKPGIQNDEITLNSNTVMEKLAVSFALAQSVKLSSFEDRVEAQIEAQSELPEELARTGSISLSSKEISMRMGLLFMERNEINLNSDILDTPEYFWENDEHLPLFKRVDNYLEVGKRVELLNTRLGVMKEMLEILSSETQNRHSTYLEWIIIVLIVLEVLIELVWNIILVGIFKVVD